MHEGSRAISKARAPAGPEGVGEGEWGRRGREGKGLLSSPPAVYRPRRLRGHRWSSSPRCSRAPCRTMPLPPSSVRRAPVGYWLPSQVPDLRPALNRAPTLSLFLCSFAPDKTLLNSQTQPNQQLVGCTSNIRLQVPGHNFFYKGWGELKPFKPSE